MATVGPMSQPPRASPTAVYAVTAPVTTANRALLARRTVASVAIGAVALMRTSIPARMTAALRATAEMGSALRAKTTGVAQWTARTTLTNVAMASAAPVSPRPIALKTAATAVMVSARAVKPFSAARVTACLRTTTAATGSVSYWSKSCALKIA